MHQRLLSGECSQSWIVFGRKFKESEAKRAFILGQDQLKVLTHIEERTGRRGELNQTIVVWSLTAATEEAVSGCWRELQGNVWEETRKTKPHEEGGWAGGVKFAVEWLNRIASEEEKKKFHSSDWVSEGGKKNGRRLTGSELKPLALLMESSLTGWLTRRIADPVLEVRRHFFRVSLTISPPLFAD